MIKSAYLNNCNLQYIMKNIKTGSAWESVGGGYRKKIDGVGWHGTCLKNGDHYIHLALE